jgi:hypothetical protein
MATLIPDRVRLPFAFDPARLAADLALAAEGGWTRHYVPANYEGDWDIIPLRAPAGETHPLRQIYADPGATSFVDTPLLARTLYFRAVLARFHCPLRTVRLMRLTPGSAIKPHEDSGLDPAGGMARIHVPILTSKGAEFLLNGRPVEMAAGEAWYLRLSDTHAAANRGTSDRVHLVIDAWTDDWLDALLRDAAGDCPLGDCPPAPSACDAGTVPIRGQSPHVRRAP